MKIVNLSSRDIIGGRFNGYALSPHLRDLGVQPKQLTYFTKQSGEPSVYRVFNYPASRIISRAFTWMEKKLSLNAVIHPQSWGLPYNRHVRDADILHLHIIYDGWFSLLALPFVSNRIPTIWTWHDPYPMTGHCVHPLDCERWKIGCGECPYLDTHFAMLKDRTKDEFERKYKIYSKSKIDVVVASNWMRDMASSSPLANNFRIHIIPHGIDLSRYRPLDKANARAKFGIQKNDSVIFIRARRGKFKGFEQFITALRLIRTINNLTIITVEGKGLLGEFKEDFKIIDIGWTNNEDEIINAYAACDFFVMNSTAEAFGLMAVEAMACGRTVLCQEGTSLPDVTFAPEVGLVAKRNDIADLANLIKYLIENPEECERRGLLARKKAVDNYDIKLQAKRTANLYQEVLARIA